MDTVDKIVKKLADAKTKLDAVRTNRLSLSQKINELSLDVAANDPAKAGDASSQGEAIKKVGAIKREIETIQKRIKDLTNEEVELRAEINTLTRSESTTRKHVSGVGEASQSFFTGKSNSDPEIARVANKEAIKKASSLPTIHEVDEEASDDEDKSPSHNP